MRASYTLRVHKSRYNKREIVLRGFPTLCAAFTAQRYAVASLRKRGDRRIPDSIATVVAHCIEQ